MIKGTWLEPVAWWVLLVVPITALCVGMYSVGQQVLRQSMNDIPVMMAEDGAARLDAGGVPAEVMPLVAGQAGAREPLFDIGQSLAPWVAVFDPSGKALESSGRLDGGPIALPQGVFQNLDFWRHGHSWQPRLGVRQDVALVPTKDGRYVVAAGQNMREMERHVLHLGGLMLEGWLATLAATLVTCFVVWGVLKKR